MRNSMEHQKLGVGDKLSGIPDRSSDGLAAEMRSIARDAAGQVRSGDTVKAQLNRAFVALGRPPEWRLREAWYGAAHSWLAKAADDFRARHRALLAERDRRAALENKIRDLAGLEAAGRLSTLRDALRRIDPEFHAENIGALDLALRRLRGG